MMTKFKSQELYEKYNAILAKQKYTLNNPPSINQSSFIIEQDFLRHIKSGHIPNLEQYLDKLNCHDWTCLLSHNPRQEFLNYLSYKMVPEIDWKYVMKCVLDQVKNSKLNSD